MHLLPCHRLPCSCILRLSPFRLSDLCNAVALEKPSTLVDDVHVSMLRLLLAEAAISAVQMPWGRVSGANLDSVTWPETLRRHHRLLSRVNLAAIGRDTIKEDHSLTDIMSN